MCIQSVCRRMYSIRFNLSSAYTRTKSTVVGKSVIVSIVGSARYCIMCVCVCVCVCLYVLSCLQRNAMHDVSDNPVPQ